MSIRAARVSPGSYKAMDSLERMWYMRKVPESPVSARWKLTNDFEDTVYVNETKSECLSYVEASERVDVLKPERMKSKVTSNEELKNFDFSDPDSYWPDSI